MTTYLTIPISGDAGPSQPTHLGAFAVPATRHSPDLASVAHRIRKARRIVVICGAGVSTAASIPDFRSANGLFSGSGGHGVKDLFHVKSISSPSLLPHHHALITDLHSRATSATPTAFHKLMASLNSQGRLLRCYTQNIDGLEARAGLDTGIPPKRVRSTPIRKNAKVRMGDVLTEKATSQTLGEIDTPNPDPPIHPRAPRCVPLHGQLMHLHCALCSSSVPIESHLPLPEHAIACPTCDLTSSIRSALSERKRRVGTLRASVVLYGEEHPEGDLIGTVVERDLRGTGRRGEREGKVDLMIVAGTSLSIPGVKRIVKEMAKSLGGPVSIGKPVNDSTPIRTIYLNDEPPSKPAEWDGVFDIWVQGDIQRFADLVTDPTFTPVPVTPRKVSPRKITGGTDFPPTPTSMGKRTNSKRKGMDDGLSTPTKRTKTIQSTGLFTPLPTPPHSKDERSSDFIRTNSPTPSSSSSLVISTPIKYYGNDPFADLRSL